MQLFTLLAALALPGAGEFPVAEWVALEHVVDGDTLLVRRAGRSERLRLLCVDTEERFHPGQPASTGKPQTVFGEETALWAESFLGACERVGLCFPGGNEQRDVWGRLLCHVVLPDGRDYELELVRAGRSPYFDKYGESQLAHAAFAAAQGEARQQGRGIWNPATNRPSTPGVPAAKRDYARLLPWWKARAEAVADFRRRLAAGATDLVDAQDAQALARCVGREVEVFGEPRSGPRELRLEVPAEARALLEGFGREYRQNYFYARGRLERRGSALVLLVGRAADLRRAGPEPAAR